MNRIQTAAFVVVAAAPLFAPRAEACSYLERTVPGLRFSVDDGAVVPQNLVLFSEGIDGDDGSAWWLVDDTEAIRLEMTVTSDNSSRFEPTAPLSPSTTYRLRWSPSAQQRPGVEQDGERAISVTTTGDDDGRAPAAPTVTSETLANHPDPFSTCGPGEAATWARFFVAPDDNDTIAAYQLFDDSGLVDQNVALFGSRDDDDNFYLSVLEPDGGSRAYRIVALDHAGNESEPTIVDVNLGCPGSCSSADLTGVSSLAAVLLLARRRRSRRC